MIASTRVLRLWADLVEAQHGVHHYGGDTAEVYVYRMFPTERPPGHVATAEEIRNANSELWEVCMWFAEERHVSIEVDGRELGGWLRTHPQAHRWHIRVSEATRGAPRP